MSCATRAQHGDGGTRAAARWSRTLDNIAIVRFFFCRSPLSVAAKKVDGLREHNKSTTSAVDRITLNPPPAHHSARWRLQPPFFTSRTFGSTMQGKWYKLYDPNGREAGEILLEGRLSRREDKSEAMREHGQDLLK